MTHFIFENNLIASTLLHSSSISVCPVAGELVFSQVLVFSVAKRIDSGEVSVARVEDISPVCSELSPTSAQTKTNPGKVTQESRISRGSLNLPKNAGKS